MPDHFKFDDSEDPFEDDESPEEWDEDRWEAYFQEEDRKHQRFQELLDQYGDDEEGIKKAFEEMGWRIPEMDDAELEDSMDKEPEDQTLDERLEAEFGSWEPEPFIEDDDPLAHPLFKKIYQLCLEVTKMFQNIEVDSKEDPLVVFLNGLYEAMSKLIRAGYHDLDSKLETPKGLMLACLKRVRKSLLSSLLILPGLKNQIHLKPGIFAYLHDETLSLLREINDEIKEAKLA
ncbi:MAG: hypothetical protein ONB05_05325 [candidate division KSB1 bacterium]|nr:hypothetical protein [candidate division KSB1 bacterium]